MGHQGSPALFLYSANLQSFSRDISLYRVSTYNQLKLCFLQATGHLHILNSKGKPPAVNPLEWHSRELIKAGFLFFSFQLRTEGDINDDQEKSNLTCVVSS